MPLILCIETASEVCSVALADENGLIGLKESKRKNSHAEVVTVFIESLLQENKLNKNSPDAIVVSKGPGSYTGLRIGVSTAKGLCYALGKPLIAINTLTSMAAGIAARIDTGVGLDYLFCPMLDARRMEVYAALYNHQGKQIRETKAEIIDNNSFSDFLIKYKIVFFGNGADKCKGLIQNKNAIFVDYIRPSAEFLIKPALMKLEQSEFEDVAYFEPFYLKDFIAGKPRVKGLK